MSLPLRLPNIGITGWGEDVNQNFTDLEELLSGVQQVPGIQMGGDFDMFGNEILDVEDIELTGALTNFFATLDTRYYTQAQVLELIAGAQVSFWLSDTADGVIGGYNRIFTDDTGEAKSSIGPTTINAAEVLIQAFVTAIDQPDFVTLAKAVYNLEIHSLTTTGANVKDARIRWRLYSRTHPAGVETLLITSEDGMIIDDQECHCSIPGILTTETVLDPTDRLVLKVYGVREGAEPQDPAVTIFMEGNTAARIETHTSLGVFDSRYLLLNGDNSPTADVDWGGFKITNVGTVDGVDISALKTDVDEFPDQLKQLLTAEIQQLENIGATTLSAGQWAWLGSLVNLLNLTEAEAAQLLNIGANEISAADWAVVAAGGGGGGFTDRGDPAAWDWELGDLVEDGGWHDLDCSAIVPAGATAILFRLWYHSTIIGRIFEMRTKGNANNKNAATGYTQVASHSVTPDLIVACDGDRKVEYAMSSPQSTLVRLTVAGWWAA